MSGAACILWKTRRTVAWLNLSLAARGAVEGIVVALDAGGELRLGKPGLPGLAALLGRPWAECEPAIVELLDAERFVYDALRGVLSDPQHTERQGLELAAAAVAAADAAIERPRPAMAATAAIRPRRPQSMTPNAIRKREKRQAEIVALMEQLELPAMTAVAAAPLSDLNIYSKTEQRPSRPAAAGIAIQAGVVHPACLELSTSLRPELPTEVIARSWKRFALRKSGRFNSWEIIEAEWEGWIAGEKHDPPKSERRPIARAGPAVLPTERPTLTLAPDHDFARLFAAGSAALSARASPEARSASA